MREFEHGGVLGRRHHCEVVAHLRFRQPGRRGVAVAAVLRHFLGQFALPFLHETVALGFGAGDLLGQFLLFAEIGVEAGLGVDQVLARIDQL